MDAIRTKTFYAFVSTVPAEVIKARHRRIEEALNSPWVTHYWEHSRIEAAPSRLDVPASSSECAG